MPPPDATPDPAEAEAAAEVARRAAAYCRMNFPSRWEAGRPARDPDCPRWLIPVVLRLPSGAEVELGQLAFDGETLRLLTPRQAMVDRARSTPPGP
jgi:hypothetical protein